MGAKRIRFTGGRSMRNNPIPQRLDLAATFIESQDEEIDELRSTLNALYEAAWGVVNGEDPISDKTKLSVALIESRTRHMWLGSHEDPS